MLDLVYDSYEHGIRRTHTGDMPASELFFRILGNGPLPDSFEADVLSIVAVVSERERLLHTTLTRRHGDKKHKWAYVPKFEVEVANDFGGIAAVEFEYRFFRQIDSWTMNRAIKAHLRKPVQALLHLVVNAEDIAEAEADSFASRLTAIARRRPTRRSRLLAVPPEEFPQVVMAGAAAFETHEDLREVVPGLAIA
ncbi:MAG TPA: hypothetical protein VG964_02400 [Candidatus Saccharimonadales bacterium]|nr:hypothetical protein [Candidatus Saccharimonadales bacterium]